MALRDAPTEHANFGCVVMLTWSSWHTEMRSNRYHFATRFARMCPVYFVQPDLGKGTLQTEAVPGHETLTILHVSSLERNILCTPLTNFLEARGHKTPLLWCYNHQFAPLYCNARRALRIYHATEDYFRMFGPKLPGLAQVVRASDLVICVSEGVRQSLEQHLGPLPYAHVVTNGCDYGFYTKQAETPLAVTRLPRPRALYQGNISAKVDFALLLHAVEALPDVTFVFAGKTMFEGRAGEAAGAKWNQLMKQPNVYYLGQLPADALPGLMGACDVGLIPFVQEDWIVKPGFPLKAFEYLASGLPVVSTPLDNLRPFETVITFTSTWSQFARAIRTALRATGSDEVQRRRTAARAQDYDLKFAQVQTLLATCTNARPIDRGPGKQVARKRVFHLVPGDPGAWAGVAAIALPHLAGCEVTIIGIDPRPAPDRDQPVLEKHKTRTLIRRPLVPVPWRASLGYVRALLAGGLTVPGLALAWRIVALAAVRLLMGGFYRTAYACPVWLRHVVKKLLFAPTREPGAGKATAGAASLPNATASLSVKELIQVTHTFVHAIEETMVRPDLVLCEHPLALLAAVRCKGMFGCAAIYAPEAGAHAGQSERSSWLAWTLERCCVGRTETVQPTVAVGHGRKAEA